MYLLYSTVTILHRECSVECLYAKLTSARVTGHHYSGGLHFTAVAASCCLAVTVLYCTPLQHDTIHCTVMCFTLLLYDTIYCTVLYCTLLQHDTIHCTVIYSTVLYYNVIQYTAMCTTLLPCTTIKHYYALHCAKLQLN